MPHVLNIAGRLWRWLITPQLRDPRLEQLLRLVVSAANGARMHAYATSIPLREMMVQRWSDFRVKAGELSSAFPILRPKLERLSLALDELAVLGRQGCLPPETYGKFLFSEANVCHLAYRDLEKLAGEIQRMILRH